MYFSLAQRKVPKRNIARQLGLRLPSFRRWSRNGKELVRLSANSNSFSVSLRAHRLHSAALHRAGGVFAYGNDI